MNRRFLNLFNRQARAFVAAAMAVVLVGLASGISAAGDDALAAEYALKAANVFYFAKFVEWPAGALSAADTPIVIGVLGADAFRGVLDQAVRGKAVNGRKLVVQRLTPRDDPRKCRILFVGRSEKDRVDSLVAALKGCPVLTVSETDGFAQRGGMINFFLENERVRFEVNLGAVANAHLAISSRLLALARIVKSNSPK